MIHFKIIEYIFNLFILYEYFLYFSIISIHIDAFLIDHLYSNLVFYIHVSGFKF